MRNLLFTFFMLFCNTVMGQYISGIVIDDKSNLPVAYVNIGVPGKNIGTVSDVIGRFNLQADSINDEEIVLFTCIGYLPVSIKMSELKNTANKNILMQKRYYELREVTIAPKKYKQKSLGVITRSRILSLILFYTYRNSKLSGYEYAVLMKIKKSAVVKKVNIDISECTYDTLYFRLNIYNARDEINFENILTVPIYINITKEQSKNKISIDLQSYNIVVDGDFLVSLELVKDIGPGLFTLFGSFTDKTYYRMKSQGKWGSSQMGIGISVDADVEK